MSNLRRKGQLLPIAGIVLIVGFTLASSAANILPGPHQPTLAEQQAADRAEITAQRQARIVELQHAGDRCAPSVAHELARLYAMDGRWSDACRYADDYATRCGDDPVVRHWASARRSACGVIPGTR